MAWGWYNKWDPQFQKWILTYGEIPGTEAPSTPAPAPAPVEPSPIQPEPAPITEPAPVPAPAPPANGATPLPTPYDPSIPPTVPPPSSDPYKSYVDRVQYERDYLAWQKRQEQLAASESLAKQQALREAARSKALAELPGLKQKLGTELLSQQEQAFKRINPIIEQRLNALGLLQSGALPEAQAKYQADLESQRQARLSEFGLGAEKQLSIDAPISSSITDADTLGRQYLSDLELGRAGASRGFGLYDVFKQEQEARRQQDLALEEARRAREERRQYAGFAGRQSTPSRSSQLAQTTYGGTYDFTPGGNMYSY